MSDSEKRLRSTLAGLPQFFRDSWNPFRSAESGNGVPPLSGEQPTAASSLQNLLSRRATENIFERMHRVADSQAVRMMDWVWQEANFGRTHSPSTPPSLSRSQDVLMTALKNAATIQNPDKQAVISALDAARGNQQFSARDAQQLSDVRARMDAEVDPAQVLAELERGTDRVLLLSGIASEAEKTLHGALAFGTEARRQAATPEWDSFFTTFGNSLHRYVADDKRDDDMSRLFSLIYIYWLDEGGVFWAAERLADRLHNGVVPSTAPLKGVRLRELSTAAQAIALFSRVWRQGHLSAVGERAAQYSALYGYPLHIAGRTVRSQFVDAMTAFPASFNGALVKALRYYRDRRNTWINPDPTPARQAFDALGRILDQGNENLRLIKPIEFRAQLESIKLILGGDGGDPVIDAIASDWRAALSPRPGVADRMPAWQSVVDSVADRYALRSVSIADYHTLAETSELLLFLVRVVHSPDGGISAMPEGNFRAFLELIQDQVQRYTSAYANVTGVDLGTESIPSSTLAEPPAVHLASRYAAPAVGPLRDDWPRPLLAVR